VPSHYQEKYARKKLEKMKIRFGRSPLLEILIGDGDEELRKSIAYVRVKNRIRMAVLYFFAELNNLLVLGTINKTEWLTGLFVPYGDGAADFMPLKHLYKTQIIKLAKFSNLPERIINKPPSPDLAPGITDEDILGIPYEKLDLILCLLEENTPVAEIASRVGMEEREIVLVQEWVKYSEKLRKMI
jgi:NAD+ synthase